MVFIDPKEVDNPNALMGFALSYSLSIIKEKSIA